MRGLNADETLDEIECNQFVHIQVCMFNFYQEYFLMYKDGMDDVSRFTLTTNNLKMDVARPGTHASWNTIKVGFDPAFAANVDDLVRQTTAVDSGTHFAAPFKHFAELERTAFAASRATA